MVKLILSSFYGLLFSAMTFTPVEGALKEVQFETYPERLGNKYSRSLSTLDEKGHHVDEASYRLKVSENDDWILDMEKNKELLSPSFVMRTFASDGSEIIKGLEEGHTGHCQYQGRIRGLKRSSVILNTCEGLRGVIYNGKESFNIEPERNYTVSGVHKVFKTKSEDASSDISQSCGAVVQEVSANLSFLDESFGSLSRMRRTRSKAADVYKPYLKKYKITEKTRYNELLIVVDNQLYKILEEDEDVVRRKVETLVNVVDGIYREINIQIVLAGLEIWTKRDQFKRSADAGTDLSNFKDYRNKHLREKIPHDNAHLLSWNQWSGIGGMAWTFATCTDHSVGINDWNSGEIERDLGPYDALAHEMGHNFGFDDDKKGKCKCLTASRGCCMLSGKKEKDMGFTDCNLKALKELERQKKDRCLYNNPRPDPECGNSFIGKTVTGENQGGGNGGSSATDETVMLLYKSKGKCLTPSSGSCSPGDNDPLILGDCTKKYGQFSFGSDGVLSHSCSGKMVCPEEKRKRAKLVVSSRCSAQDASFEQTGQSLMHTKTEKCVRLESTSFILSGKKCRNQVIELKKTGNN